MAQKDRTIRAYSHDRANNDLIRRRVLEFFNAKSTYKIYLTYMGLTRWCEGKVYKFSMPAANVNKNMELQVTFLCPNPYLKSYDDFGQDIASLTGMIAFPYLCNKTRKEHAPVGVTGAIFNFAQTVSLFNDGDTEAQCRIVIYAKGSVENPLIRINGNMVRLIDTLQGGDEVVFDFTVNPPTVKKNDINIIGKCDRNSAFDEMGLQIGDNSIEYDAQDGANMMNVSVYYNKLYCGI